MGILKDVDFFMKDKGFRCEILEDLYECGYKLGLREVCGGFIDEWIIYEYDKEFRPFRSNRYKQIDKAILVLEINEIRIKTLNRIIVVFNKNISYEPNDKNEELKKAIEKLEYWITEITHESKITVKDLEEKRDNGEWTGDWSGIRLKYRKYM